MEADTIFHILAVEVKNLFQVYLIHSSSAFPEFRIKDTKDFSVWIWDMLWKFPNTRTAFEIRKFSFMFLWIFYPSFNFRYSERIAVQLFYIIFSDVMKVKKKKKKQQ